MCADQCRNLGEDSAFFVAFGELQFANLVVGFHNGQRFHEQCRAAGRLVMDNGLDFAFELSPQRNHITSIALSDDGLLQHGHGLGIGHIFLQAAHQAVVRDAQIAADIRQFDGSRIQHFAAFREDS